MHSTLVTRSYIFITLLVRMMRSYRLCSTHPSINTSFLHARSIDSHMFRLNQCRWMRAFPRVNTHLDRSKVSAKQECQFPCLHLHHLHESSKHHHRVWGRSFGVLSIFLNDLPMCQSSKPSCPSSTLAVTSSAMHSTRNVDQHFSTRFKFAYD